MCRDFVVKIFVLPSALKKEIEMIEKGELDKDLAAMWEKAQRSVTLVDITHLYFQCCAVL